MRSSLRGIDLRYGVPLSFFLINQDLNHETNTRPVFSCSAATFD
jgi:hypothetical protein